MSASPERRDPQRLFTDAQRREIAERQNHMCGVGDHPLPEAFHVHHVIPWADGGPTQVTNGLAVCPECHASAPVAEMPEFTPRNWQQDAFGPIMNLLRRGQFATLNAAPGAGKTLFTAWLFRRGQDAGAWSRCVVFVPTAYLRTQWAKEVAALGVHLDSKFVSERPAYDGAVLTYQALSDPAVVHQVMAGAEAAPTLLVLDEVHHLGQQPGGSAGVWAVAVEQITGGRTDPRLPVLNLTGTLFRSKRNERISTVDYEALDDGRIETKSDYSITAGRLISEGYLRHIRVLAYDSDMKLEAVDLAGAPETVRAVDLDANKKLRSSVLASMIRNDRFIKGVLSETVNQLAHASTELRGAPVKGLVIADSTEHADQVYEAMAEMVGRRHVFIAHGKMASPDKEIDAFRKREGQATLVAVQMVTEGFDAPDLCTLTYLSTWRAPLFINQMAGRVMRTTRRERETGRLIPATVLIPNEREVKDAFAGVLTGAMGILEAPPDPCPRCGRLLCTCPPSARIVPPKQCDRCGQPSFLCVCVCAECGLSRATGCRCRRSQRDQGAAVDVEVLTDPELADAGVDGNPISLHLLDVWRDSLKEAGISPIYHEQAILAYQEVAKKDPMSLLAYLRSETVN